MIGLLGTFRDISAFTVILSPTAGTWIFWYPMLDSVALVVCHPIARMARQVDLLGLGKARHSCSFSTESHALFQYLAERMVASGPATAASVMRCSQTTESLHSLL